jgi:hypothetical protein
MTQAGPQGVTVPTALYSAMAHCYYGSGPRYREAVDPLPSEKAAGPVEETLPQSEPMDPADLVIRTRPGWKACGKAKRTLEELTPPQGTPQ